MEQRCQVFIKLAEQPRHIGLDCSRLGPTTAAFSLRMISPGDKFLVATMYLNQGKDHSIKQLKFECFHLPTLSFSFTV
jgi:hypothetical protein